MEDLAYLLVPFAQISFGAATIAAIIFGMDEKRTKWKAYLVPVVIWGWILAVIGTAVVPVVVKMKYNDPETAPAWVPTTIQALLIYGAVLGMTVGSLIGAWHGAGRWKRWRAEAAAAGSLSQ